MTQPVPEPIEEPTMAEVIPINDETTQNEAVPAHPHEHFIARWCAKLAGPNENTPSNFCGNLAGFVLLNRTVHTALASMMDNDPELPTDEARADALNLIAERMHNSGTLADPNFIMLDLVHTHGETPEDEGTLTLNASNALSGEAIALRDAMVVFDIFARNNNDYMVSYLANREMSNLDPYAHQEFLSWVRKPLIES